MKKYLLILLITCIAVHLNSQNLITNPGFELYSECPPDIGLGFETYITNADGWDFSSPTPDFFHTCGSEGAAVPDNYFGAQSPATGEGYGGFAAYLTISENGREGLITPLYSPLEIGQTYYCSFKVSLAEDSGWACNNISMFFSTHFHQVPFTQGDFSQFNEAHIVGTEIISDSINWVTISGSFVADSAYTYVSITNHFDDSLTQVIEMPNGVGFTAASAYYYIDDICVTQDAENCDIINSIQSIRNDLKLKIYPTLTSSNVHIDFEQYHNSIHVEIYNQLGQLIKKQAFQNRTQLDLDMYDFSSGMYLIRVEADSKYSINKIIKE